MVTNVRSRSCNQHDFVHMSLLVFVADCVDGLHRFVYQLLNHILVCQEIVHSSSVCLPLMPFHEKNLSIMANKRMKNTRVVPLPLDIIIAILSRLSVKSLLRLKCVCKDWFNLISDSFFVYTHLQHAKANSGFIVEMPIPRGKFHRVLREIVSNPRFVEFQFDRLNYQSGSINRSPISSSISWDPFFIDTKTSSKNKKSCFSGMAGIIGDLTRVGATCDGLVLLESLSKYGLFYVCNPAMRRWVCLGREIGRREGGQTWGLVFNPNIRKYSAVRMTSRRHRDICEIITVDENFESWTEVWVPQPHRSRSFPPVYANSCIHWMIHHRDLPDLEGNLGFNPQSMGYILTMDVISESFHTVSHPKCKSGRYTLLQMRGLLSFADHASHNQLDLWVLMNVKKPTWTKEHSIHLDSIGRSVRTKSFLDDLFPLAILENPRRIIFKWTKRSRKMLSYEIENRSFSAVNLQCFYTAPINNDILGDSTRWCPKVHANSLSCWT